MLPQRLLLTSELEADLPPCSSLCGCRCFNQVPPTSLFFCLSLAKMFGGGFLNLPPRYCQRRLFHPHLYFLMGTLLLPWAPCPIPDPVCQKITTSKLRRHAASSAPTQAHWTRISGVGPGICMCNMLPR